MKLFRGHIHSFFSFSLKMANTVWPGRL